MNQNLKLRILTAAIGVPLILAFLTSLGVEGVAIFSWIVSTGLVFEFSKMFFHLEDAKSKTWILIAFNTVVHALNFWLATGIHSALLGLFPVYGFFILFLFMVPKLLHYGGAVALNSERGIKTLHLHVQELMALCFGWVYCGWFPLLMVSIRTLSFGKHWLILTLIIVWASDTFAYFAGKFCGKHLLYETVSPKKTWEGLIGGELGAVLTAVIYAHFFLPAEGPYEIAVIALALSSASAVGDLCESLIKRAVNIKDSGTILPGHGGFLDRFDGVLFAVPLMYLILKVIS